jgi:hypothetical protein
VLEEEQDFNPYGYSISMGPNLREFVEEKLLEDLQRYIPDDADLDFNKLRFDWSKSCIEGHEPNGLMGKSKISAVLV